jgi:5-methylcytosine-specific restriction endonuclease McrA
MSIYHCLNCNSPTTNPKFCSRSCSASNSNKGKRRHGKPKNNCLVCGEKTKSSQRKYCSFSCVAESQKKNIPREEILRRKRFYFMSYYMKKKNQTPSDADMELIREIYLNCPEGYEVDHIIPISKGGLHHQDNLQYLTISENRSKGDKIDWCSCQDSNLESGFRRPV